MIEDEDGNPVEQPAPTRRAADAWQEQAALRTVGKLRFDERLHAPLKKDSLYVYCTSIVAVL